MGIVIALHTKGLGYGAQNRVAMPRLACAHTIRSWMLDKLFEGLQYSHHAWLMLCANGEYYDQHPSDRVLEILDNGPESYFNTAHIERCLARQAEDCQACKTKHIQSVQVSGGHWASGEDEEGDDEEDRLEPEDSQDEDRNEEEDAPEDSQDDEHAPHPPKEYPGGVPTSLRKSHKVLERAHCHPSMKPRTPKATIQIIELQPQHFEILH